MTIYRVSRPVYEDYFDYWAKETIGYYTSREMAEYVAEHYSAEDEYVQAASVEEIEVQNTCPKF